MIFHFVKRRKIWYIISLLVIIPGLISLMTQGFNLGIDFTGGSLVEVRFDEPVQIDAVRNVVASQGLESAKGIQKSGDSDFLIRTKALSEEESNNLLTSLEKDAGKLELLSNESVSPVISGELVKNALFMVLVAAALMLIYITIRFEFKQGIATIVGLLHDVLVVMGVFSLLQIEINGAFVAAVLTVIGYSINDTIIIFDRVRENSKLRKKNESVEDLVNVSLWQTLIRSINTVLTVIFVLVALYILGGSTIKNFILAMLVGFTSGVYSSIFIASSTWVELKLREKGGQRVVNA